MNKIRRKKSNIPQGCISIVWTVKTQLFQSTGSILKVDDQGPDLYANLYHHHQGL